MQNANNVKLLTAFQVPLLLATILILTSTNFYSAADWLGRLVVWICCITYVFFLMLIGQVQIRHNKTVFAWGFSVGMVALMVLSLAYVKFVLHI